MKLCLLPGFRYHVTSDFCLPIVSYTKIFIQCHLWSFQVLPVISRRSCELAFHLLSFGRLLISDFTFGRVHCIDFRGFAQPIERIETKREKVAIYSAWGFNL